MSASEVISTLITLIMEHKQSVSLLTDKNKNLEIQIARAREEVRLLRTQVGSLQDGRSNEISAKLTRLHQDCKITESSANLARLQQNGKMNVMSAQLTKLDAKIQEDSTQLSQFLEEIRRSITTVTQPAVTACQAAAPISNHLPVPNEHLSVPNEHCSDAIEPYQTIKTMENVRRHKNIELVHTEERLVKVSAKPTYKNTTIFNEDLVAVELHRAKVDLFKPIYCGMCILDLSKCLMYDFWYNYIKQKYQNSAKLQMTDIDSVLVLYSCETDDLYEDMKASLEYFDTSDYPEEHFLHKQQNKKVLGKMKDETMRIRRA